MKSLAARFARAVNRALGRTGPVLRERYHALGYALANARRHPARLGRALPRAADAKPREAP